MFRFRFILSPVVALLILLLLGATTLIIKKSPYYHSVAYASTPLTVAGEESAIDRIGNRGAYPVRTQLYSSDYFWLTDEERSRFGEYIWFFGGDSVYGRVRTNHDLGVHTGAYFGSCVFTGGVINSPSGSTFRGLPAPGYFYHVPQVPFPTRAEDIRSAARSNGYWLPTSNRQYVYGLWFHGSSATIWRWNRGTPAPPYLDFTHTIGEHSWDARREHAIFCDGELWISGSVHGIVGIGAAGNIRLMDNLIYSQCANQGQNGANYPVTLGMTDVVTIVSEASAGDSTHNPVSGILIANTWANGRENGYSRYNSTAQDHRDIAIHAFLIALNSEFTFEQQNDSWDPYIAPDSLSRDERGYIHLTGGVTQKRRGYVHRSNHGGSGYFKDFRYDPRFDPNINPNASVAPFAFPVPNEFYSFPEH